jgi:hypothetical protein
MYSRASSFDADVTGSFVRSPIVVAISLRATPSSPVACTMLPAGAFSSANNGPLRHVEHVHRGPLVLTFAARKPSTLYA